MIVILAQFEFPTESRRELIEIARDMDEQTSREPGCIHYKHAIDVSDDRRLLLSEVWSDTLSLRQHFNTPHFEKFREAARRLGVRTTLQQLRAEGIGEDDEEHVRSLLSGGG